MSILKFSVSAHSENPTKTVVSARNFTLTVDEPANLGGTDHGATPVEYLLAAFAGCLNVVGHLIAKEMNINMKGIKIDLDGDLDPSRFTGKSKAERAGFKEIRVTITPDADADADVLAEWLKAVEDRCPISDNIQNITPVKIALG